MITFEDFAQKCDVKVCLRKRKYHEKGCLLDSKRQDCYSKFLKTNKFKVPEVDERWEAVRTAVWKRDAGILPNDSVQSNWKLYCQFYRSLTKLEQEKFVKLNQNLLWLCVEVDVAHLKGKGAFPELKYDESNCVLMNRLAHSRLDVYKDPFTGDDIDSFVRESYIDRIRSNENDRVRIL